MRLVRWSALLLVFPALVSAQSVDLLSCPQVNYFGPSCHVEQPAPPSPPPPAPVAAPPAPAPLPLFSKETVSPHMDPLLLTLLQQPGEEAANAEAYVARHAARMLRLREVQPFLEAAMAQHPGMQELRQLQEEAMQAMIARTLAGGTP